MASLASKLRRVRVVYLVVALVAVTLIPWSRVHDSLVQHRVVLPRSTATGAPAPQLAILGASSTGTSQVSHDPLCEQHPEQCGYAALLCDDELVRSFPLLLG